MSSDLKSECPFSGSLRRMIRYVIITPGCSLITKAIYIALLLLCCIWLPAANAQQSELNSRQNKLNNFFQEYAKLTSVELKAVRTGSPVVKEVNSDPEQVLIFGAIFIKANPDKYLAFASDIDQAKKIPGYLAFQEISEPPQLSDLETFSLEADDIKDLQKCKPNECEVQLPENSMEEFRNSVNWKATDVAGQVNTLAQQMALRAIQSYIQGGNTALGTYRDKKNPNVVAESFNKLLAQAKALPVYMPDLHKYLLEYPNFQSPKIQSEFHWEKVKFGLKPTLRIVHHIIYKDTSAEPVYAMAEKQLYSSHYFQTALDITVAVADSGGFYLITTKGSQQAGLTGFKGNMVRGVAISKSKTSLENVLEAIKKKLEQSN
jgi:hypothetical protein